MDWFIKLHAHTIKENTREWVNIQNCVIYIYMYAWCDFKYI